MKRRYIWMVLMLVILCVSYVSLLPYEVRAAEIVADGTCGENLAWALDSNGVLTISGDGDMFHYNFSGNADDISPWRSHSNKLKSVVVGEGVTSLGNYAFANCSALKTVTLPDTLDLIGDSAFLECVGLEHMQLPANLTNIQPRAFMNCTSLVEMRIPEGLTYLGSYAFWGCTGLKNVVIPNSLTFISDYMLADCSGLTKIELHSGITKIGSGAFSGCTGLASFTLPEKVTVISERMLSSCKGLKQIVIPDGITEIGSGAFYGCTGLTSVVLPETIREWGNFIFNGCTGLSSVTLPDTMTRIPFAMFDGCSNLKMIELPAGIVSIEGQAFMDCIKLKQVNIPANVTEIGNSAFNGCTALETVTLPSGLTAISEGLFASCSALKEVVIPERITSIGRAAFSGCTGLTQITIPAGVTSIGGYAFYECGNLVKAVLPDGLTVIEEFTFAFCMKLEDVNLPTNLKEIYEDAFKGVIFTELILPEGLERIDEGAFYACLIDCVYVPSSVKSIGYMAFDGNTIWHVLYGGTEKQWNEIQIGGCNLGLTEAYRHYNSAGNEIVDAEKMICSICGQVCTHKWDNGVVTKEPTCAEEGVRTYTCQICGNQKTESVEKQKEHTYDHNCDKDCNICGAQRTVSHSWDSGKVTKNPSCAEEGIRTYTCTVCAATATEAIAKTEEHTYGNWVSVDGYFHKRTCNLCKQEETASHTWDNGVITERPTCAREGTRTYTCSVCSGTKTEAISRTEEHSYGEWIKLDESTHRHICSVCAKEETEFHTWDSGTVTVQATCAEEGIMTYTCAVCCGTKTVPIAKTDDHVYDHDCDADCNVCAETRVITHSYTETWLGDADGHWHECSICGHAAEKSDHEPGPEATEESPQSCTVCGIILHPALGHTHKWEEGYSFNKDGHWHACPGCSEKIEEENHSFDHGCDADCNICGYERVTEHTPGPEATETEDQICTECGALLMQATGPATEPTEPTAPTVPSEPEIPSAPVDDPAQTPTAPSVPAPVVPEKPKGNDKVVIAVGAIAAVTATGGGAVLFLRKRKK